MIRPATLQLVFGAISLFQTLMISNAWAEFDAVVMIKGQVGDRNVICTGVAIAPRVILTAGHCVDPADLGGVSIAPQASTFDVNSRQFVNVPWRNIHPLPDFHSFPAFTSSTPIDGELIKADLAVITLDRPLHGLPRVFPQISAQVPVFDEIQRGESIGYGARCNGAVCPRLSDRFSGNALDEQIERQNRQIRHHKFWRSLAFIEYVPGGYMVFADPQVTSGDSGGPVYLRTQKGLELVGLSSTVEGRGESRKLRSVSLVDHLDWIHSVAGSLLLEARSD